MNDVIRKQVNQSVTDSLNDISNPDLRNDIKRRIEAELKKRGF